MTKVERTLARYGMAMQDGHGGQLRVPGLAAGMQVPSGSGFRRGSRSRSRSPPRHRNRRRSPSPTKRSRSRSRSPRVPRKKRPKRSRSHSPRKERHHSRSRLVGGGRGTPTPPPPNRQPLTPNRQSAGKGGKGGGSRVDRWWAEERCLRCFLPRASARDGDHQYPNCPFIDQHCRICREQGHIAPFCHHRFEDRAGGLPACERCSKYPNGMLYHKLQECPEYLGCAGPNCNGDKGHLPKYCPDAGKNACFLCGSHNHVQAACTRKRPGN